MLKVIIFILATRTLRFNALFIFIAVNFNKANFFVSNNKVEYPEIRVRTEPALHISPENEKFGQTLENVFERFDAICRFYTVSIYCKYRSKLFG